MDMDLEQLLAVPVVRAFDVDSAGRVLASSDERGSAQLIEVAPDGTVTELTALPGACTGRYVPGQRMVIVSHDEGGNENAQLSLLRPDGLDAPAGPDDLIPLIRDPRYVHNLAFVDGEHIGYITNRRNGVDFDAVIHELTTGVETVAYTGGGLVSELALSPDGTRLALTVVSDQPVSAQLLLIDLRDLAAPPHELTGASEHAIVDDVDWTPDGAALLLKTNRGGDFTGIARIDIATGRWDWLVTDDARDLTGWLAPDGRSLLVEANDDGGSRLALYDAITGAHLRDITLPADGTITGNPLPSPHWSPDSATIVASISSPAMPGDALRIDPATGVVTQLSDSARHLGGQLLTMPEAHRIPAHDGEKIPCLVYRPAAGGQASVVLVHGGPEAQAKRNYNPYVQALVQAGYTVLVPNVRGSVGYGKRWYSLDDVRLRLDSVADLASIHAYLPSLGLDQARAALWGGSYGGYMVLAGVAFQPELWAAGVDIVGMSSLVTFLENTSPYRRAAREREYGSLAHDRDFLTEASPLTRIDDVRAPLFVIHGANDPRVPVSEAKQLRAALTANGVECELLIYDDEGHGLAKRANRLDAFPKAFAFLDRHLNSVAADNSVAGETAAG
jgi:dipeptidyl aminopeptidase/acylaminoacyl peptidase